MLRADAGAGNNTMSSVTCHKSVNGHPLPVPAFVRIPLSLNSGQGGHQEEDHTLCQERGGIAAWFFFQVIDIFVVFVWAFMGLLDKLWDDTVAGPQPESGLGRLRKCATATGPHALSPETEETLRRMREKRPSAEFDRANEEIGPVTRSITIVKPPYLRSLSVDNTDIVSSPSASSPPTSPYSLTPREGENSWRTPRGTRRKMGSERREKAEPRSPTVYDWVVISALDR